MPLSKILTGSLANNISISTSSNVSFGGISVGESITNKEDTDTRLRFPSADTFTIETDGTERVRVTANGDFQFDSGYGSVATAYACRAWVNFNGTGTVAIRDSGNVSSITDNGTGNYTINFTNAMPDANYAVCAMFADSGGGIRTVNATYATTSVDVRNFVYNTGTAYDGAINSVAIFR